MQTSYADCMCQMHVLMQIACEKGHVITWMVVCIMHAVCCTCWLLLEVAGVQVWWAQDVYICTAVLCCVVKMDVLSTVQH